MTSKPSHLDESSQKLLLHGDATRIRFILRDRVVMHRQFTRLANYIAWTVREPVRTRARGLVVRGSTGSGKTTLSAYIAQRYPRPTELLPTATPFAIMISITGARNARTVYGRILEALGGPVAVHHRLPDREQIVTRLLTKTHCRLMVLDEMQDILAGTDREQRRVLDGVKYLMNELKLPIVATGTKELAEVFAADKHLAARFTTLELTNWKDNDELLDLLGAFERILPLRRPSRLTSPNAVKAILEASDGILDHIVRCVKLAAVRGIASGDERVTVEALRLGGEELPDAELLRDVA